MRKWLRVAAAILGLAIVGALVWRAHRPLETICQGKTARSWIWQYSAPQFATVYPELGTSRQALNSSTKLSLCLGASPPLLQQTPPLPRQLAAPEPESPARAAIRALGSDMVPALLAALRDPNNHLCVNAAGALGELGPINEEVVNALVQQMARARESSPHKFYRMAWGELPKPVRHLLPTPRVPAYWSVRARAAALALRTLLQREPNSRPQTTDSKITDPFSTAVPALAILLADRDDQASQRAAYILGRMGPRAGGAIPALIQELPGTNHSPEVRVSMVRAIGAINPAAHEPERALAAAAQDPNRLVQCAAIVALGRTGREGREAMPLLRQFLKGEDKLLRSLAYEAMTGIDPQGMKGILAPDPPSPASPQASVAYIFPAAADDYSLFLRFHQR